MSSGATVALLRHFPTDWNGEGRIQGRTDRPLTAEATARIEALRLPVPWDRAQVTSSPLVRARETAERLTGGPVCLDPRLVEIGYGDWEGRLAADLLADPESGFVPMERWGWHRCPPGGESPANGYARVRPLLAEIAAAGAPRLLILHRALMRAILAVAWGWDYDRPEPFEIKRGRLYPLRLAADGTPRDPGPPLRLEPRA